MRKPRQRDLLSVVDHRMTPNGMFDSRTGDKEPRIEWLDAQPVSRLADMDGEVLLSLVPD